MKDKIKYIFIFTAIFVSIISMFMANSFGFFEYLRKGINPNTIKTANIVVELDDNSSLSISSTNAYPLLDEVGRTLSPYVFTLKNLGDNSNYELKVINDVDAINKDGCTDNLLSDQSIRYQLIKNGNIVSENIFSETDNRIIDKGVMSVGASDNYELRIWIDSKAGAEVMNKHFHGKIEVLIK